MSRAGNILRTRRKELHLTQEDVALEAGIHSRQYQRYESGENDITVAGVKPVLRICLVLELDPFELIFKNGQDVAGK